MQCHKPRHSDTHSNLTFINHNHTHVLVQVASVGTMALKRKHTDDDDDLIRLDDAGDVVLVVSPGLEQSESTKRFLVNSSLLSLSSKYFKALFSEKFAEGQRLAEGHRPKIDLKEDEGDMMEIVLRKLHFINLPDHDEPSPEVIMGVAVVCNKYAWTDALCTWIRHWAEKMSEFSEAPHFAHLAVAAHLFQDESLLECVTHRAALELNRKGRKDFLQGVYERTGRDLEGKRDTVLLPTSDDMC